MTRLEKPFPLEVTWGFPSRCKHSWLPLELYWGFLESEGGIVTFKLYPAPEWVIWQTLESDQPAWLRSPRWQADSVCFALVLHGSKTTSCVELFHSLWWLTHCRLLCKMLATHSLLKSPPPPLFFFFWIMPEFTKWVICTHSMSNFCFPWHGSFTSADLYRNRIPYLKHSVICKCDYSGFNKTQKR